MIAIDHESIEEKLSTLIQRPDWIDELLTIYGQDEAVEPEAVLYHICDKCKYNYEKGLATWLYP
jgi:hypothetical protein